MDDDWQFVELTPEEAAAILDWRYAGRYAFYDTEADPEFAAEFAGFFAFKGSPERCVIGLGLAPELTGRSLTTAWSSRRADPPVGHVLRPLGKGLDLTRSTVPVVSSDGSPRRSGAVRSTEGRARDHAQKGLGR